MNGHTNKGGQTNEEGKDNDTFDNETWLCVCVSCGTCGKKEIRMNRSDELNFLKWKSF
jgi:hypothetical protein